MTTTDTTTTRTITLTDRAPVRIVSDSWPIISSASWHDGEIESQATRRAWMKVRQNAAGRTIVYGGTSSRWQGAVDRRGGELMEAMEPRYTVEAIHRVADDLGVPENLVRELIADLPAVEIE